jgi:hypothetical protein
LGVIAESVPNRTLRGSGMIPRLDVAVDGRRRARPVWRAALCGQHAALESVTERLRGTIPILAARAELSRPRNGARKVPRPHRFARLGTHRLQRRLRLAVRTAQTEGFGPAKAAIRVPPMPRTIRFRTDSAMTPVWIAPLRGHNAPQPGGKGFAGNPGIAPPQEYPHHRALYPRWLRADTADGGSAQ